MAVLALAVVVGSTTGAVAVTPEVIALVLAILVGFLLGYFFYGCLFAISGAVVSRREVALGVALTAAATAGSWSRSPLVSTRARCCASAGA